MRCPTCGSGNPDGKRFCEDCGGSLLAICPACGAQLTAGKRFCGDCGAPVGAATALQPVPAAPVQKAQSRQAVLPPTTEVRQVSVLFCDLVGFTPLSESRDPEDVRALLSGYFDLSRSIVSRYGGIVEKFIGDAVMAVWGARTANEDDAERAVRAGLELVSAVAAYGRGHEVELAARVGVVTGEVATLETWEEGMVAGDAVNTAARIQSVAPPGCCYVDETTRAASAAAIAYRDTGEHALKGKSEPARLFEAARVVATVAGSERSSVLEAPFIGRDHELRLVKELFHTSSERRSARLVLVSGVAGIGKSRLAWEFEKYIDGLAGTVLWHAGRCLSYGEGVSYWALSEMVRARLQIAEEDPQEIAAERLKIGLERWIPDPADREFIAPRLGQLLGLPGQQVLAKEELFSGWRLFFERLSEHQPVVMVIQDLQWADPGMVEFLDHLLDWSADHAIFLLVLTRPEGTEKKGLVLTRRSVTTVPLHPLPDEAIGELLEGLVPDLPASVRSSIVQRAEGIPLYAIETIRSLLDKGILTKGQDDALHLTGELGDLETPPGLTALIASRLDALSLEERQLVKECSVLGSSFPRQAVEAVSDIATSEIGELLTSLMRKEILTVRADRLSPERGQYAFTQSIIRSVAYDTLTRQERKARHLRTASHLRASFPEEGAEVAEVIAVHLSDAYKAARTDPDADELREEAKKAYVRAAERAEAVGAPGAAEAFYLTATELSPDETEGANLTEKAGRMAFGAGHYARSLAHFEVALSAYEAAGRLIDAAQLTAKIGQTLASLGRGEEAIVRMTGAISSLGSGRAPPAVIADLQESLGRAFAFTGHGDKAAAPLEEALRLAQHFDLPEPLARALNARAVLLTHAGRAEEGRLLFEGSASVARRHGLARVEMSAEGNLADLCMTHDLPGAEEHCQASLAIARRWGDRGAEAVVAGNLMYVLTMAGSFDKAYRLGADLIEAGADETERVWQLHLRLALIDALRGRHEDARRHLAFCEASAKSDDPQDRAGFAAGESAVALASGDVPNALKTASQAIQWSVSGGLAISHEAIRTALPEAIDAAIALPDLGEADRFVDLIDSRPPGEVAPFLRTQVRRARSLLAAARGNDEGVEGGLVAAEKEFFEMGYPYWTARAQLELAEWLDRQGHVAGAAERAAKAVSTFERLGVEPMLVRARAALERMPVKSAGSLPDG